VIVSTSPMLRHCQQFVDCLVDALDGPHLEAALGEAAALFDLPSFAYLLWVSPGQRQPLLISNYPSGWTGDYLARRFDRIDPVIARAGADAEAFAWGPDVAGFAGAGEHAFFSAAAAFGIRYGFTIPLHDAAGRKAALTFASPERHASFARTIELNLPALQLVAHYFHRHAAQHLAPLKGAGSVVLTQREYECLQWASRGKSAWETGRIIGIARRTVAFHLENAKAKLGVHSLTQAVALLISGRAVAPLAGA
jgi:DNA-binding CsgD family transcriptional regulator